jgi:hypothetical protein
MDYTTVDMTVRSLLADILRTDVPPPGAVGWGFVDDNGALIAVPLGDLAGVGGTNAGLIAGVYEVQPGDVTNPASDVVISVPGATSFGVVGVSVPSVSGQDILTPGTDYASAAGQLTLSASLNPPLQAGYLVHYGYGTGSVQPGGGPAYTAGTGVDLTGNRFSTTRLPLSETQAGNYTLALVDAGCLVPVSSASAVTVTVPAHADVAFPIGSTLYVAQDGAGQVSIAGANGVVVQSAGGYRVPGQWTDVALHKRDLNTWILKGAIL